MKFLILSLLLSFNAQAFDGNSLIASLKSATNELSFTIDASEFQAYQAEIENDEAHIFIKATDEIFEFGCHYHDEEIFCHEHHDHKLAKDAQEKPGLAFLQLGERAALDKLSLVLNRNGTSLASLTEVKVWSSEGRHDHKSAEQDVWVKTSYQHNNISKTIYQQCHSHGDSTRLFCHFQASAQNEPNLER